MHNSQSFINQCQAAPKLNVASRRQIRGTLTLLSESIFIASRAATHSGNSLRRRAFHPANAPTSISGQRTEAEHYQGVIETLHGLHQSVQRTMAEIESSLRLREQCGKGRKRWWVPKRLWDRDLEFDVELEKAQILFLSRRLEEVQVLWGAVHNDS
ncbi:hypothetical protein BGX38DRAFT_1261287 [Terfezia claveryi]|nr:hypothetical protein BGX38DRAFT_1261287 [Terfezia claveryi]